MIVASTHQTAHTIARRLVERVCEMPITVSAREQRRRGAR